MPADGKIILQVGTLQGAYGARANGQLGAWGPCCPLSMQQMAAACLHATATCLRHLVLTWPPTPTPTPPPTPCMVCPACPLQRLQEDFEVKRGSGVPVAIKVHVPYLEDRWGGRLGPDRGLAAGRCTAAVLHACLDGHLKCCAWPVAEAVGLQRGCRCPRRSALRSMLLLRARQQTSATMHRAAFALLSTPAAAPSPMELRKLLR